MAPSNIHVIGIDPGETTGWALLSIPRKSIFGDSPSAFTEISYGEFYGPEDRQAIEIARLAREVQSLDYKVGPALVVEDFDLMPNYPNTNASVVLSPVRIAAKINMLYYESNLEGTVKVNWLGDAKVVMQGRTLAKATATDERLKAWGLYVKGSDHIRDAMRHAITAIRRAKGSPEFCEELWNCPALRV